MAENAAQPTHVEIPQPVQVQSSGSTEIQPQPFQVELTDDKNCPDLIGPGLIALAAIIAASLAAWVATRNHKEQLAHDREMRDREETRSTIDDVVNRMTKAVRAVFDLETAIVGVQMVTREEEEARVTPPDENIDFPAERKRAFERYQERFEQASELLRESISDVVRLRIRFPEGHPVPTAYEAAATSLDDYFQLLGLEELSVEEAEERKAALDESRDLYHGFLGEVRTWIAAEKRARSKARTARFPWPR